MKNSLLFTILLVGFQVNAQVEFVIVCNQSSQTLEIALSAKVTSQQKILKKGFPNQSAAEGYLDNNRKSLRCGQTQSSNTATGPRNRPSVPKRQHNPVSNSGGNPGSLDIHGVWSNEKNDCLATFIYTGQYWIATVHKDSQNNYLNEGEVIAELYPGKKNKVKGRMKILKKDGRFEWKEVEYKMELTQLKGKHSWKFFAPSE